MVLAYGQVGSAGSASDASKTFGSASGSFYVLGVANRRAGVSFGDPVRYYQGVESCIDTQRTRQLYLSGQLAALLAECSTGFVPYGEVTDG